MKRSHDKDRLMKVVRIVYWIRGVVSPQLVHGTIPIDLNGLKEFVKKPGGSGNLQSISCEIVVEPSIGPILPNERICRTFRSRKADEHALSFSRDAFDTFE